MEDLPQAILHTLKVGKKNAIKQKPLAVLLCLTTNAEKRAMRRTIADMRHKGAWILSCSKGYYIAETLNEIKETRKYRLRYVKSLCVTLKDLKIMENNFNGQIPLHF